ncbi:MAG: sulfatase [Bacteroidales bacterium]|nr:sulfatase [Bacteroidales bacterium]
MDEMKMFGSMFMKLGPHIKSCHARHIRSVGKFFYFALLILTGYSCSGPGDPVVKPNIIFILVDDLGWTDLGCYGSTFHETPNIDRLAGQSMRFTDAYAACPVCSPTRASIMTGKYPARINVTDWIPGRQTYAGGQPCDKLISREFELEMKLEEITIAEALEEAGYRTFFAGKWHLGEDSIYWPEHQGFEINMGGWSVGSPRGGYFSPYVNPRLESGPEGECLTDRLTDESIRFMEAHTDGPFFLFLSFYTVHTPLQGKPELIEKYERKIDDLGLDPEAMETTDQEWIRYAAPRGRFKERVQQGHPTYASMIETLDNNVGRLMKRIGELEIADHTIVLFMSDNGGLSTSEGSPTTNFPLRAGKGWLYEGGIREPMFIKWPGSGSEGSVSSVPVTSTDFYPTILQMAGVDQMPGQHMDGISLAPLLTGEGEPEERPIFWHYPHYSNQGGKPGAAIRLGDLKLIEFFEDGDIELFDLSTTLMLTRLLWPCQTFNTWKQSDWPLRQGKLFWLPNPWDGMQKKPGKCCNWLKNTACFMATSRTCAILRKR